MGQFALALKEVLPYHDKTHGLIIVSDCFLTNRETLIAKLQLENIATVLTDSQIILHAYLTWQEQCAAYFEGDTQFAIWNDKNEKLFVVTNRIPDRFTYVYHANGTVCVSTQLPPLRYHIKNSLNSLKFNFNNFKQNIFPDHVKMLPLYDNIIKMQYGTYLIHQKNQLKEHIYWDLKQFQGINQRPYNPSIIEEFRELYKSVLQKRLKRLKSQSACQFSGGLDSTLLLHTLHSLKTNNDKTKAYLCHLDSKMEENILKCFFKKYGVQAVNRNFLSYHFANKYLLDNIKKDFDYAELHYLTTQEFKPKTLFELADWGYQNCDSNATNFYLINHEMATRSVMQSHQISLLFTGYFGNALYSWNGKIKDSSQKQNVEIDKKSMFSLGYQKNVIDNVKIYQNDLVSHLDIVQAEFYRKQHTNTFLCALDQQYSVTSFHPLADPDIISYCLSLKKEAYTFEHYNRRLARDLLVNILNDKLRLHEDGVMSNIAGGNITYFTDQDCKLWIELLHQHKHDFQDFYDIEASIKYLKDYMQLPEFEKIDRTFKNESNLKKCLIHFNFVKMLFFFKWLCLEYSTNQQHHAYSYKEKELFV